MWASPQALRKALDLVVERLPVAVEHHLALDDDVDFLGAGGDRFLDLAQLGIERREAVREGRRDGGDRNAGALERLHRGRDERVIDADRGRLDVEIGDAEAVEDLAASADGAPWRRGARRGRACRRS